MIQQIRFLEAVEGKAATVEINRELPHVKDSFGKCVLFVRVSL
jgi:hypothetical protein